MNNERTVSPYIGLDIGTIRNTSQLAERSLGLDIPTILDLYQDVKYGGVPALHKTRELGIMPDPEQPHQPLLNELRQKGHILEMVLLGFPQEQICEQTNVHAEELPSYYAYAEAFLEKNNGYITPNYNGPLTEAELRLTRLWLYLVAEEGSYNLRLARLLGLSNKTVTNQFTRILKKCNASCKNELLWTLYNNPEIVGERSLYEPSIDENATYIANYRPLPAYLQ